MTCLQQEYSFMSDSNKACSKDSSMNYSWQEGRGVSDACNLDADGLWMGEMDDGWMMDDG